jgi:hypothetical protein
VSENGRERILGHDPLSIKDRLSGRARRAHWIVLVPGLSSALSRSQIA